MTAVTGRARSRRRPAGPRGRRAARRVQPRPACSTPPTCTSPRRLGALGGERRRARCCWRLALAVRGGAARARCASTWPPSSRTVLGEGDELVDVSALPWPDPAALAGRVRGQPAGRRRRRRARRAAAAAGRRAALPRPVLAQEELVAALADRARRGRAARRSTCRGCAPAWTGCSRRAGAGPAAAGRRGRRAAPGQRAGRRAGHRQDHHGRPAAARCCSTSRARRRGSRWPRRPARPPPGCRRRSRPQLPAELRSPHRRRPPRCTGCSAGGPARSRFRHDRTNRLPFDVVVVDETSMVSLTMMARLLEAVRPQARLVLVGDPDQLASVEAGAVLGDLARAAGRAGAGASTRRWMRGIRRPAPAAGASTAWSPCDHVLALRRRDRRARPAPCRPATPTPRSTCSAAGARRPGVRRDRSDARTARARRDVVAAGRDARPRRRRAGDAAAALAALERAPPAVRAPARARTASPGGPPRSSGGCARRSPDAPTRAVVPRAAAAGHRERLRHRAVQRRHRRGRRHGRRACGSRSPAAGRRRCSRRPGCPRWPPCTR